MGKQKIKCFIWDLDHTLWDGILVEDKHVTLKQGAVELIKELDSRGILQSISSKNNFDEAMAKLKEFELDEYFIYPQINWNPKSNAVRCIADAINIGIDTLAFIDDQAFEREEINFTYPEVLCIDAADIDKVSDMEEFIPRFITEDSRKRRTMYQNDIMRGTIEENFEGSKEEFLRTLKMIFTVHSAQEEDLKRVEELTVRTHQLNSTGYIYSYEELKEFIHSDKHEVLVAQLNDKYGEYGKIGLALIEKREEIWELKLMLMSCRVMTRGVGTVFLNQIVNRAKSNGVKLWANFVPTDRNRIMYITYKFGGFREIKKEGDLILLDADMTVEREIPDYITLVER